MFSRNWDEQQTLRSRQNPGLACNECRRRKKRCDRRQPQCGLCALSGTDCQFMSNRAPRRRRNSHINGSGTHSALDDIFHKQQETETSCLDPCSEQPNDGPRFNHSFVLNEEHCGPNLQISAYPNRLSNLSLPPVSISAEPTWRACLSDLVRIDLDQLYFDRVQTSIPILNQNRYLESSRMQVRSRYEVCLQYAMWTLATSLSSQFQNIRDGLYTNAQRMLRALNQDSKRTGVVKLEQVQASILLVIFEFTRIDYKTAIMNLGPILRQIQLLGLYKLDCRNNSSTRNKSPPFSNSERETITEEKRRTFWMAYSLDRFLSLSHGVPLTINDQEIRTRLPAPENDFQAGNPTLSPFLFEVMTEKAPGSLHTFAQFIVVANLCGRCLSHKQRSTVENLYDHTISDSWDRHQWLISTLSHNAQLLPGNPPINTQILHPMALFANMVTQSMFFYLSCTGQVMPKPSETQCLDSLAQWRDLSVVADERVAMLIQEMSKINQFKVRRS
ncbi:fungal-specific transcription factor domain-containing protein [Aspergillus bertholletiae]|uniref:Fungal-specific transcription factor domain-containing protein n=1 Tax=Aspergillus bertholletiae TaxID=1226010 RepID=A0A5N7AT74_9EURO|nr:fungal-specific transcription factor domain-containing protein [Aspergillus bertholletiae]